MAEPMSIYRLEDLSVIYFVKDLFSAFPQIKIVDEFPNEILTLPTISVVNGRLIEEGYELGNRDTGLRTRRWSIDLFVTNKTQRDDFAYKILEQTTDGINVRDYNEGFPPTVTPTVINHLSVISKTYTPISVIPLENEKLYYRGQLTLITTNDKV